MDVVATAITKVPLEELIADREESIRDIAVCEYALAVGVVSYSGGLVLDRLATNKRIVEKINNEIARRDSGQHPAVLE